MEAKPKISKLENAFSGSVLASLKAAGAGAALTSAPAPTPAPAAAPAAVAPTPAAAPAAVVAPVAVVVPAAAVSAPVLSLPQALPAAEGDQPSRIGLEGCVWGVPYADYQYMVSKLIEISHHALNMLAAIPVIVYLAATPLKAAAVLGLSAATPLSAQSGALNGVLMSFVGVVSSRNR